MTMTAGKFRAKGVAGALGYTKDHNPQVAVELKILDTDHLGDSITWFGYFTEKTQERTLEALRILGWKTDDLSNLDGITDNEVSITVEEEEYMGEVKPKVQWINRIGGIALKERMSPAEAQAFARQMKGAALASRAGMAPAATAGKPPAPRAPAQRPAPPAGQGLPPEDDIPF
jgi:hypothetical protein